MVDIKWYQQIESINGQIMKNKMTEKEYLVYNKILFKAIKYFANNHNYHDYEELQSKAYEVLLICLKNYKDDKGCKFTTYLYNNSILKFKTLLSKENKGKLYKYKDYNNKKELDINKEDVFDYFKKEESDIQNEINFERIINIIEEKVIDKLNKVEIKKYNYFKESIENERKIELDRFLLKKIRFILKENYNITEKDLYVN